MTLVAVIFLVAYVLLLADDVFSSVEESEETPRARIGHD
jgi:hypothetical protein